MKTELEIKNGTEIANAWHLEPFIEERKRWVSLESHETAMKELKEQRSDPYFAGYNDAKAERVARDAKIIELLACATNELPSGDCHQTIYWINEALSLLEAGKK